MHEILTHIQDYGVWFYPITFIWTALEGETFVVFAALAAQKGLLNIYLLFLAAWLGSFCGDQVAFWIGRKYGIKILERTPRLKPKLDRVLGTLEKYATVFILSYRFMYGIRNISGLAIGMSKLSWKRFVSLNLLASFIWAFAFCGAGFLFGDVIDHLGKQKEDVVNYSVREVMLAALGLFAVIIVGRLLIQQIQKKYFSEKNESPKDENKL